jgi:hypothetical protein
MRKKGARTLQLRRGIEDGAAVGNGGDVDQRMQVAERRVGPADHPPTVLDPFQIGRDVMGGAAATRDLGGDRFAPFPVAAADHQARRPPLGERAGDRLAQALGAAGDDRVFAGELFRQVELRHRTLHRASRLADYREIKGD